ncbi:MAG TPA: hypothetical protein PKH33_03135 [bacterium]|nr:hypothetical protein [bacterium]
MYKYRSTSGKRKRQAYIYTVAWDTNEWILFLSGSNGNKNDANKKKAGKTIFSGLVSIAHKIEKNDPGLRTMEKGILSLEEKKNAQNELTIAKLSISEEALEAIAT